MKERPILFNGAMVRAVLAGTKTQTRRVVKPQPREDKSITSGRGELAWQTSVGHFIVSTLPTAPKLFVERCPYGQPGDQLWVRETWARDDEDGTLLFRADDNEATRTWEHERIVSGLPRYRWRPSIHMPRWASRILLEIVSVRVERLQDISEADCIAEGCAGGHGAIPGYQYAATPYEHYRWLWESINGPGSWDANPWVWEIEFRRIDRAATV